MFKRILICALTLAALAATPAVAADTVVVPGVDAKRLTALDGTIVWTTGDFPRQTLMQRTPDGTVAPVKGAPVAVYPAIDLGHDGSGELVLTYQRCTGNTSCKAYSDDLDGRRVSFKRLEPAGCALTSAPARWGARVAYGRSCDKRSGGRLVHDPARSGLFVRKGAAAPKRLRLPKDAVRFGIDDVTWVDLRGTIVAGVATDVYKYAFAQTVNGSNLRSNFVASSEGDGDAHVVGQSLGSGGVLWTLVDAIHVGDPNQASLSRLLSGTCGDSEAIVNAPGAGEFEGFRAVAMAVDGTTIYLQVPGTGIVTHTFAPTFTCR